MKTPNKTNITNIDELLRQIDLLKEDVAEMKKNNAENSEPETEEETELEESEVDEAEVDNEIEVDDDGEYNDNETEIEADDGSELETEDETEVESDEIEADDNDTENTEEVTPGLSEKLDKFISDFEHFRRKTTSLLEAILAASRISIGLKESETPRVVKEKKVLATLNTASGKLKKEVAALTLRMDEEGALHITQISKVISKGDAVEEELDVRGKIPNGNWIVVERKENYYLVSVDNFNNAENVTPYENEKEEKETNEKKGIVVNKKGVAHNVGGYELEDKPDYFKLTKESLNKPKKVRHAKWTKQGCDYPIKGEPVPEGKWVIVVDEEGIPFLVKAENVEPKISTKRTEKKEVKKAVKKVTKKIPTKKAVKKVVKKKK